MAPESGQGSGGHSNSPRPSPRRSPGERSQHPRPLTETSPLKAPRAAQNDEHSPQTAAGDSCLVSLTAGHPELSAVQPLFISRERSTADGPTATDAPERNQHGGWPFGPARATFKATRNGVRKVCSTAQNGDWTGGDDSKPVAGLVCRCTSRGETCWWSGVPTGQPRGF